MICKRKSRSNLKRIGVRENGRTGKDVVNAARITSMTETSAMSRLGKPSNTIQNKKKYVVA